MFPNALFESELAPGLREPIRSGRFVGRERELARLREVIAERNSATALVAGFRGAGKTSLVEEAIKLESSTRRLVVRIAPPYVGNAAGLPEVRSQILRSLARGLYFAVTQEKRVKRELRDRVEAVYEKTYLTELERHRVVESAVVSTVSRRDETVVRNRFELSQSIKLLVGSVAMGFVATLGVGVAALVADRFGLVWAVAAALFVLAVAVASGYTFERTQADEVTASDALTQKDARSELGRYDLSDETLEFELRTVLTELSDAGYRVVFVLDELDKLEFTDADGSKPLEESKIFAIVASLKNFFTLGNAAYVFITDQAFFEQFAQQQRSGDYMIAHTIFTDAIYVGPLHYSEIERLIDSSMKKIPVEAAYDQFKNFVCWQSRHHAFDALQVLGAFVEMREGKRWLAPTVSGESEGAWREGSMPENWLTMAALQKHVGVAYDDSRRTGLGEDLFNQALWDSLRSAADELLDGGELVVPAEYLMTAPGKLAKKLSAGDQELISAAAERMLRRLERHKAVVEADTSIVWPTDEGSQPVDATSYSLAADVPYPPSTIGDEEVLLPVEQLLVDTVERLEIVVRAAGGKLATTQDRATLMRLRRVVREVRNTGPRRVNQRRSVVALCIPEASELAQRVIHSAVTSVVTEWAESLGASVATSLADARRPGETWQQELSRDFEPLSAAILEEKPDLLLVAGGANEYGLLVLALTGDEEAEALQTAYASCLDDDSNSREERQQRLPVVHVGVHSSAAVAFPEEFVDVYEEVKPSGWLRSWFQSSRRVATRESHQLKGWTHFALDDDLGNLAELQATLARVAYLRSA